MEVADARGEKQTPDETQQRIAKITVQEWHCAWLDAATESVADHHRVAGAQCIDECVELGEIVAVVGIGHDHESPAGSVNSADQRTAITVASDTHDSSACLVGEFR